MSKPPKLPADESNWHDWLTLGGFVLSALVFALGIAATVIGLHTLDQQQGEIKSLQNQLTQLSEAKPPSLADSLRQQNKQTMQDLNRLLDQKLAALKPTPDPRLDKLATLENQLATFHNRFHQLQAAFDELAANAAAPSPLAIPHSGPPSESPESPGELPASSSPTPAAPPF